MSEDGLTFTVKLRDGIEFSDGTPLDAQAVKDNYDNYISIEGTSMGGTIRPIVDRRLPMSRAAEAHRVVEASEHVGKVLLLPAD